MKNLIIILLFFGSMLGCQNAKPDEVVADDGHGHDHGSLPILIFSGNMELFAEADELFQDHDVEIRAHLTFLDDYSPAEKGNLYARISQGRNIPSWKLLELAQPGIYTGLVIPKASGDSKFEFKYEEEDLEVLFTLEPAHVYTHDEEPPVGEHLEGLAYTKEQAWQTLFGLMSVEERPFSEAINCSGEIIVSPESEYEMIAPVTGTIHFAINAGTPGQYIKKGSILFYVLPTGTGRDNLQLELVTAQSEFEKAKADFNRKEELLKLKAVSSKEFEAAQSAFKITGSRYEIIQTQLSKSGIVVKSPVSGYITEITTKANSFVKTGDVLLRVIEKEGLLLKANVPSSYSHQLPKITSANFKAPGQSKVFSLDELDGKLVSTGRIIDSKTGMIPVYFTGNLSQFLPGTFVELWLLTEPQENQVLVPKTSILEEYGLYYVCVQIGGETYEKRKVEIAGYDGYNYKIGNGLTAGEVIVSKGVMAVKIANAIGAPPAHSH